MYAFRGPSTQTCSDEEEGGMEEGRREQKEKRQKVGRGRKEGGEEEGRREGGKEGGQKKGGGTHVFILPGKHGLAQIHCAHLHQGVQSSINRVREMATYSTRGSEDP